MKNISFALIILIVSSCSLNSARKPDVSIVDVRFTNATLFETTADFTVRIANPSSDELSLDGAAHDIYLNGIHVGKGLADDKINIPRLGSTTQTVSVHISNLSLLRNIQDLIDAKSFDYKIDSTLYVASLLGLSNYHVVQGGHFENNL